MKARYLLAIRAFDFFAAICFGAASALVSSFVVPEALGTPLGMIAGMIVGTVAAIPLLGLFTYLLGGFEIVVMSVQIGMVAGMAGVMTASEGAGTVVLAGAVVGLTIQLLLYLADRSLHGEVVHDE